MSRARTIPVLIVVVTLLFLGRIALNEFVPWDDRHTLYANPRMNPPTWRTLWHYAVTPEGDIYIPLTQFVWAGLAAIARTQSPDPLGGTLNSMIFHGASVLFHALGALAVWAFVRRVLSHGEDGVPPTQAPAGPSRRPRDVPAGVSQTRASPSPASSGVLSHAPGSLGARSGAAVPAMSDWAAFFGALVFAIHPVQVESVAWASGLKDVLCGLFIATALWQYTIHLQTGSRRNWWYATAAAAAAMLSKPTGVVLPVMAGVLHVVLFARPVRGAVAALWPWMVLAAGTAVVAKLSQPAVGVPPAPPWARPVVALDAIAFYVSKLIVPIGLTVDYARTPAYILSTGFGYVTAGSVLVVVLVALFVTRGRAVSGRVLWGSMLIAVAGVLPVLGFSTFLFQYYSTTSDHYLYPALIGVAVGVAWVMKRLAPRRRWAWVVATAWLLALGVLSFRQAGTWRDEYALWRHATRVSPRSHLAHLSMGDVMLNRDDVPTAMLLWERAAQLNPRNILAYDRLIHHYALTGRYDAYFDARRARLEALESYPPGKRPDFAAEYEQLGDQLLQAGLAREAADAYETALRFSQARGSAAQKLEIARIRAATRPTRHPSR